MLNIIEIKYITL